MTAIVMNDAVATVLGIERRDGMDTLRNEAEGTARGVRHVSSRSSR